jgi:hypothetical protein
MAIVARRLTGVGESSVKLSTVQQLVNSGELGLGVRCSGVLASCGKEKE